MKKGKLKNITIIILCFLIVATLAFIWGNSIPGKTESASQSEGVYQTVKPTLDQTFGEDVITHYDFRKFAHVAEFFLLGAELILLFFVIKGFNYLYVALSLLLGLSVAIIDEIIQIFSNRGATVVDVFIDLLGVFLAVGGFVCLYYIVSAIKNKKQV